MKDKSLIESTTEQEINKLTKENKELKAMLKTALTTINSLCYCGSENCHYCAYVNDYYACNDSEAFKWEYEYKVKKLIGGDNNG